MKMKLAVVTLWAENVDQMVDFYKNILGLQLLTIDRGRPHFDFGGGYLVILRGKPHRVQDSNPSRFPVLAFSVDNLHEFIDHSKAKNVEFPWGIEEDNDSRWVMFYDPGGNLIEVAMMGIHKNHAKNRSTDQENYELKGSS
jgi:catechol-2,3-dioxygenase